uniref:Uncharacterized protein n=1 Tax=Lactuca sativa TaxID=4236 RepID=A0A9R1UKR0_LACSA|nr:hypothetical protein LSAT_V11C800425210 [Lactuca sativa]
MFQWSPDKSSIFGSSVEDGVLNIWDHNKVGERSGPASKFAPGLLFRHSGHRWLISTRTRMIHGQLSVCRMMVKAQVAVELYRMIDLIHRPQEEVINELEQLITSSLFLMLKLFPNLGFGNLIRVYSTCEVFFNLFSF